MIPTEGFVQPSVVPMQPHALTKDLERMKKVLKILFTHNKAGPFKKPVNAISEGIYPDYFKVCYLTLNSYFIFISKCPVSQGCRLPHGPDHRTAPTSQRLVPVFRPLRG